ncbi:hypothetical protein EVAR_95769_1 [Eumeta japonica]|uniref:Uncharacterized protein n=1 Tax=Eumeta variegata TaxID=151549 RepID=A0A4C1UKJ2_EUMVA|nr:hypothetical protein EVAR_95769_1 [Eumeta japonica]
MEGSLSVPDIGEKSVTFSPRLPGWKIRFLLPISVKKVIHSLPAHRDGKFAFHPRCRVYISGCEKIVYSPREQMIPQRALPGQKVIFSFRGE